ncbi:MAG TPA: DEAD/DEAH box helicase family protein [Candidatus Peribacterales bacterium]|nr:DEAD/DEAH box helicase family protein [Candidatus Peribacterales bacterium]
MTKQRFNDAFQHHLSQRLKYVPHANPDGQGLNLEDHQQETTQKILFALKQQRRQSLSAVASCGSGKTLVEINLIGASQAAKNQLGINDKTKDLLVTVGRAPVEGVRQQFTDLGIDTGLWSGGERDLDHPVIVAGIHALQMAQSRRELKKLLPPGTLDLLIVDEADCFLTPFRRKIVQSLHPHIKVGLTATPIWPDGRSITDEFGPQVDELDLREGILKGINANPEVMFYESQIREEDLKIRKGDYDQGVLEAAWKHAELHLAIPEVYEHLVGESDRKKFPTLVYVPSVNLVQATTKSLNQQFGEKIKIVGWDGKNTSTSKMKDDMEAFKKGEIQMIVLCEMGGRGMNLENAMLLIDAYPTMSLNKLTQRHGRVLRKVREGSILWNNGWRKNKAFIAQIVPKALKYRPALFTDILGGYQQFMQLKGEGEGAGGTPPEDPIDILRKRIEGKKPPTRVSLIKKIDALDIIQRRVDLPQEDETGFFRLPRRYIQSNKR